MVKINNTSSVSSNTNTMPSMVSVNSCNSNNKIINSTTESSLSFLPKDFYNAETSNFSKPKTVPNKLNPNYFMSLNLSSSAYSFSTNDFIELLKDDNKTVNSFMKMTKQYDDNIDIVLEYRNNKSFYIFT